MISSATLIVMSIVALCTAYAIFKTSDGEFYNLITLAMSLYFGAFCFLVSILNLAGGISG
jgi:hypothetical protein